MSYTTNLNDPRLGHGSDDKPTEQHKAYLILSEEERRKGFIRPVRQEYIHVGKSINKSKIRPLTEEEHERYDKYNYTGFIPNEDTESSIVGIFITENDLKSGCGSKTTMTLPLAETYARDPKFYGATYCCHCRKHLPVEEFIWNGTNIRVGE